MSRESRRVGPVVVLVLSHDRPELLRLLAEGVLRGRNTRVVVHHDPRGPAPVLPFDRRISTMPNAKHLRWGRQDLALAILDGLEFALARHPDLSWVLVVSGRDQLCRPMAEIEAELYATGHDAFARWFAVPARAGREPEHHWQIQCRRRYLRRVRLPGSHHSIPFPRTTPFGSDFPLRIGDAWVNLNKDAVEHVLEQRHRRRDVERFLARCTATDEALLPTLLLNNDSNLSIANSTRRFIRWTPGEAHPAVLREADLSDITDSDSFFARKFDDVRVATALEAAHRSTGKSK